MFVEEKVKLNVFMSCLNPIQGWCKLTGSLHPVQPAPGPGRDDTPTSPAAGKCKTISILMSAKTFYRLWQTISWLESENWNINNRQLAGEAWQERVLVINDIDTEQFGSSNSLY